MSYELVQSALNLAIEATAIIGFGGIVAKSMWQQHRRWMQEFCPPVKPYIAPAVTEATDETQPEQVEQTITELSQQLDEYFDADDSTAVEPEAPAAEALPVATETNVEVKPQPPTFSHS
jgi:hypothetical protein